MISLYFSHGKIIPHFYEFFSWTLSLPIIASTIASTFVTLCVHQGQHCQKDDMSAEGHDHFLLHQLQWVHYHPKRFHIKLILCESDRLIFNSWLEHLVLLRSWVQIHHGQSGQFCNFVLYLILTTCHCHATHICLCWLSFRNVSIKPPLLFSHALLGRQSCQLYLTSFI